MKKVSKILPLLFIAHFAIAQSPLIDSLQRIIALQRHDTTEIDALYNLTNEFLRTDFQKANKCTYAAIRLARSLPRPLRLINGYGYLVTSHQRTGRIDSALYYLTLSEGIFKANPDDVKVRISYNQASGLFYKNTGEFRKALPFMLDNLQLLRTENESKAGQLLNVGNAYHSLSDFKNALDFHLKALALFEKLNNKRGQSFCLQNLGNDFNELHQYNQAKEYFLKSIKIKTELQDKRGLLTSWLGMGNVYMALKNIRLSEHYYLEAIKGAHEMKFILEEAKDQFQLGLLYKQTGEISRARENLLKGLALAKQGGDSTLSAKANSELLGLDRSSDQAEALLTKDLTTFINSGAKTDQAKGYLRLSEHYASQQQYDKAYSYFKKFHALEDTVEGNAVLFQMKQLEEQYKSEKREKEIALLKKDQELQTLALSRQRTAVTLIVIALISVVIISILLVNRYRVMNRARRTVEMERMRNAIARDLHDDIGSTLSSINIISQLALKDKNGSSEHFQRIAQHSSTMMESMSDIVWSINPKNDSIEQVISKMKEFASEILDPVDISFVFSGEGNIYGIALDATLRKNLFLIFKEAINNIAKYSSAPDVTINFNKTSDTIQLVITDNGKGFEVQHAGSGNGLRNMKERAKNINGTLEIESTPNHGTVVILSLPVT